MNTKKVIVKYACKCVVCGNELAVDDVAWFNIDTRKMACKSCYEAEPDVNTSQPPVAEVKKVAELSRNDDIRRAHDENMQAGAQLRLELHALTVAILDLNRLHAERNGLIKEQMRKGG